jgi:GxxExxY protein
MAGSGSGVDKLFYCYRMKILVIGRDPKLNDENSEAFRRVSEYATLFDALHIINIGTGGEMRSYGGKLFIWSVDSRFLGAVCLGRKIVREHGIDIVDAQDPAESGLAAYLVARFAKIPLRLQIHTDIFSPWYQRASLKEWVRYRLAKFLIPRADCIRVVSARIKKSLMSNVKYKMSNVSVLPIFTDTSRFFDATPTIRTHPNIPNNNDATLTIRTHPNMPNERNKIVEKELSYQLGKIFFEVHDELGRFCRERQYADLLARKLTEKGLNFKRELATEVAGRKSNFVDFVVENKVLIEVKAKTFVEKDDYFQVMRYLEALDLELALIVNFRNKYLKPHRVLNPRYSRRIGSGVPFGKAFGRDGSGVPFGKAFGRDGSGVPFGKAFGYDSSGRIYPGYDFKIISVGRFVDKEKNFSMLLEVMREFVKVCPKALLVLVGDGPARENYKLKITNYKLDRNVIIEPWRDDLPSFLKSFDLFALPSNYEGWGRVVIEAMASGLPVVMTDVGLAGEVIKDGENGLVVPVGDKEAFFGAILDLYKNPEKRKKIALVGLETVKNLEPRTKEEYLLLYRESYKTCLQ